MAGHAVMSDMSFGISHERTLDAHAGVGYAYRFDYESPIKVWSDGYAWQRSVLVSAFVSSCSRQTGTCVWP